MYLALRRLDVPVLEDTRPGGLHPLRREEEGWGIVGGVTSSKNSDQDIK